MAVSCTHKIAVIWSLFGQRKDCREIGVEAIKTTGHFGMDFKIYSIQKIPTAANKGKKGTEAVLSCVGLVRYKTLLEKIEMLLQYIK